MHDISPGTYAVRGRSFSVRTPTNGSDAAGEPSLAEQGIFVPTDHRLAWGEVWGSRCRVVEVWSEDEGACACSAVVEIGRSRAVPTHDFWRVNRLGGYDRADAFEVLLGALVELASADRRVLHVSVRISTLDEQVRKTLARRAARSGYVRSSQPRGYERTSYIDLSDTEDAILARMRPSCRRGIRAIEKNNLVVRSIEDPALGPRLAELLGETMTRTEGALHERSWSKIVDYARDHPDSARLVGTFSMADDRLLAFALGLRQGDNVEYRTAASTRAGVDAPVGYAPAWSLIRWGKAQGAQWFDFGGLPPSDAVPEELAGIVRFKESFGGVPVAFGEEWILEPRPRISAVQRKLSAAAKLLGRNLRR